MGFYRLDPISFSPWLPLWGNFFQHNHLKLLYRTVGVHLQRGSLSRLNESSRMLWGKCFHSLLLQWLQCFIFNVENMFLDCIFLFSSSCLQFQNHVRVAGMKQVRGACWVKELAFRWAHHGASQRAFLLLSAFFLLWKPAHTWPVEQLSPPAFLSALLCPVLLASFQYWILTFLSPTHPKQLLSGSTLWQWFHSQSILPNVLKQNEDSVQLLYMQPDLDFCIQPSWSLVYL